MKEQLKVALSDILVFSDDEAQSKSGNIRLSITNNSEAIISINLPEPNNPIAFLFMGVLATFVAIVASELGNPEIILKESASEFGRGKIEPIIKNFEGGRLEMNFDRQKLAYTFHALRW